MLTLARLKLGAGPFLKTGPRRGPTALFRPAPGEQAAREEPRPYLRRAVMSPFRTRALVGTCAASLVVGGLVLGLVPAR
jgi:hypothetical protein